ncbi:hypothetical protein BXT84_14060 [Sulfobacillus thermotolerans]|uniref:Uncharacterized protein n=1 Tax=Sulfobacillus thermotolerans TaxID=338644 RepID=A0ABM6RTZ5_9FIRM|nr:hypothetical protein BXT84_14060 [Sulfobacillus thermotolerans]
MTEIILGSYTSLESGTWFILQNRVPKSEFKKLISLGLEYHRSNEADEDDTEAWFSGWTFGPYGNREKLTELLEQNGFAVKFVGEVCHDDEQWDRSQEPYDAFDLEPYNPFDSY